MKIGLFDPYLDTLGGGERYMLTLAFCLSQNHKVSFFWNDPKILTKAAEKFGEDYSNVHVAKNIFDPFVSVSKRLSIMRSYDRVFFLSDGSIPLLLGRKNFLHFQFPLQVPRKLSFFDSFKLAFVDRVIYNSSFVAEQNSKFFQKHSVILYPPVKLVPQTPYKKENIILSVGRFTKGMNMKKQETLIDTFQNSFTHLKDNWKLVLIGSVLPTDKSYFEMLKQRIMNKNIEIHVDLPYQKLVQYYQKAKIYWHAAGFGEDIEAHPERAEHFGITTVEAMSAGCVPVVFDAGGQREIVTEGENGFFWKDSNELVNKTEQLIEEKRVWKKLSENAQKRAQDFSEKVFSQKVLEIIT